MADTRSDESDKHLIFPKLIQFYLLQHKRACQLAQHSGSSDHEETSLLTLVPVFTFIDPSLRLSRSSTFLEINFFFCLFDHSYRFNPACRRGLFLTDLLLEYHYKPL